METANLQLSPEAAKFVSGPPPARMMAARGLVPLSPVDLITVQIVLSRDSDEKVAAAATQGLTGHPVNILVQAVNSSASPELLDALARLTLPWQVKEAILLSRHVSDDTLVWLAANETEEAVLEVLGGNQTRMLANQAIAEALVGNEHARLSTRKRVEEFFGGKLTARVPDLEEAELVEEPEPLVPEEEDAAASTAAADDEGEDDGFDEEALRHLLEDDESSASASPATEAEEESEGGLFKQISKMKVSAKVKLALKGNKEARMLLVKESNKMVSTSVLKNPRITDGEVIAIASSKSAIEDILRIIAGNRMWVRLPQVRSALVQNAKTPIGISLKLLPSLPEKELKQLAKSRNVSGALSQAAKRLMAQRASKH